MIDILALSAGSGTCCSGYLAQKVKYLGVEALGDLGGGGIVVGAIALATELQATRVPPPHSWIRMVTVRRTRRRPGGGSSRPW